MFAILMMICKNDERSLQKEEGEREGEREMNGRRVGGEHQQKLIFI